MGNTTPMKVPAAFFPNATITRDFFGAFSMSAETVPIRLKEGDRVLRGETVPLRNWSRP